ncbi:MAG: PAS domain-containing protein [Pirellulales bacterium]
MLTSLMIIAISVAVVMFLVQSLHNLLDPGAASPYHRVLSTLSSSIVAVVGIYLVLARYELYRERIEAALLRSEERFHSVVDSTHDWVWEIDENNVYTYSSAQVRQMLGYGPEDIVGKPCLAAATPTHGQHLDPAIASRLARRELVKRLEARLLHRDGRLIAVETTAIPLFDATGNFRGYRGIDHDVTERHRVEQALLSSEERIRFLLDESPDGIWETDLVQGKVQYNGRMAEILGETPSALESSWEAFLGRVHPEDVPRQTQEMNDHLAGLTPRCQCAYRVWTKGSAWKWVLARGKVVARDEGGKPLRMAGTVTDIDDLKQLEAERDRLVAELDAKDEEFAKRRREEGVRGRGSEVGD